MLHKVGRAKKTLAVIILLIITTFVTMAQTEDRQAIEKLYHTMYRAMIDKDVDMLNQIHDDEFVLYHMTGMRQTKEEYVNAIINGTLNYYDVETDSIEIVVNGDEAMMTGRSRVTAAVFGGSCHTWPLLLRFKLRRSVEGWRFTESRAAMY